TRIFVITDIPRDDIGQVAAAYAALFVAARGGALGLFTAITRLRAVHQRIAPALEARDLLLLAQHVDAMSTATLVDIFRAEEDSCLLGTDAVRDGVDIPGRSLRLLVFDRVPWPRPDILHRARKPVFGGAQYGERIARLRLRQAYGRLIRRADDRGVFVMLDRALPSRLLAAFPEGVAVTRAAGAGGRGNGAVSRKRTNPTLVRRRGRVGWGLTGRCRFWSEGVFRNPRGSGMLDHHRALIYTMVIVSAADSDMPDVELRIIGDIVGDLPVFRDFDQSELPRLLNDCTELISREDGFEETLKAIKAALPAKLRETAYAIACDLVASDGE